MTNCKQCNDENLKGIHTCGKDDPKKCLSCENMRPVVEAAIAYTKAEILWSEFDIIVAKYRVNK